jgi:hypothetical protein
MGPDIPFGPTSRTTCKFLVCMNCLDWCVKPQGQLFGIKPWIQRALINQTTTKYERVFVEAGVFDEDGELKQTLFTRRMLGKEIEYF